MGCISGTGRRWLSKKLDLCSFCAFLFALFHKNVVSLWTFMLSYRRLYIVVCLALVLVSVVACSNNETEMRRQLSDLQACNQADSLMTNDSLAIALCEYFDHHGTANEQMMAHYLLGRTYADLGEAPQAIEAYDDAAGYADTTAQDCDYHMLCRVYAQKAQLYYQQLLPDKMIYEERLAMKYARQANDTLAFIACYAMMGEGYEVKNMLDSALFFLKDAYQLYKKVGFDEQASSLCCSMADICRQQGDYSHASEYMQEYESSSGFLDENGDVEPGMEMFYSFKGLLCLDLSDKEGAEYYFRKLLSNAYTYELQFAAHYGLSRLYAKYYDKDSLQKYNHISDSISQTIHNEVEMQKTLQVQAMYNYSRSEQKSFQKEKEANLFKMTLVVICTLSTVLVLLFIVIYIRNRNERKSLAERIQLLSGYAINRNLYDSPIADHFRQLLKANPYQNPDLNDWKDLVGLFDKEIPDFRKSLCREGYTLSDFEYEVCMLIKIQISSSDIARLKHCTPAYITQIRKNIYKNLFSKKGRASELDEYIMRIS